MKRPVTSRLHARANRAFLPRGYTMVEILMATALMLIIMGGVVWVFGMVGGSISDSRSTLEMTSALRAATTRLSRDLKGITVSRMGSAWKPRDPSADEGYFEYTEGPMGPVVLPGNVATNIDLGSSDSTVGDIDDILMFTTHALDEPFIGQVAMKRAPNPGETPDGWDPPYPSTAPYVYEYGTIQAEAAEVIWFVRGTTLHRRVLLVAPQFPSLPRMYNAAGVLVQKYDLDKRTPPPAYEPLDLLLPAGFYNNDVSIRLEALPGSPIPVPLSALRLVANTLGDLTKPENRFAHQARPVPGNPNNGLPAFPFHPHFQMNWNLTPPQRLLYTQWATPGTANLQVLPSPPTGTFPGLGLPTLRECSHPEWAAGGVLPPLGGGWNQPIGFDAWVNPYAWNNLHPDTGTINVSAPVEPRHPPLYMGSRVGEDVILTNVISFDVKAWDPGAPVFPAINAMGTPTVPGDDEILDVDGNNVPDVTVAPGDAGYALALWHFQNAVIAVPPTPLDYGAYVDLNYSAVAANDPDLSDFAGPGQAWTPLMFPISNPTALDPPSSNSLSHTPRVYDTWSTHFDNNWVDMIPTPDGNGIPNPGEPGNEDRDLVSATEARVDEGANGIDDPGNGLDDDLDGYFDESGETVKNGAVDDVIEQEAPAPYPVPLRGIRIRIRVFEPDSRQVREMTIVQNFVTE